MASHELHVRIDNSIPAQKLPTFSRYRNWEEAEKLTVSETNITVQLITPEDILALSARWGPKYEYRITTETDEEGSPVFTDAPNGTVDADPGLLTCDLQKGANYIRVERTGGILRDCKSGEVVMGTSIWSKAKVSAFLVVHTE